MKPKAIIVSGYFNPLHKGHLELFEKAKAKGDALWVIVNSDLQRELKKSKAFMDEDERLIIVKAIGIVDKALISIDKDKTQCETLRYFAKEHGFRTDDGAKKLYKKNNCKNMKHESVILYKFLSIILYKKKNNILGYCGSNYFKNNIYFVNCLSFAD